MFKYTTVNIKWPRQSQHREKAGHTHCDGIVMQLVAVIELQTTGCDQSEGADGEATLHGNHSFQSRHSHMQKSLISHDG